MPEGLPFSKTWTPVSYRAAYTYEPIRDLMFYSMYATAYDPAVAAGIFSINARNVVQFDEFADLRNRRQATCLWDGKAEWTVALYDINQQNVYRTNQ